MSTMELMSVAQDRVLDTGCEPFDLDFFTHILPPQWESKGSRSHVTYLLPELQVASVMEQKQQQQAGKWKQKTVRNWCWGKLRPGEKMVVRRWWRKVTWKRNGWHQKETQRSSKSMEQREDTPQRSQSCRLKRNWKSPAY